MRRRLALLAALMLVLVLPTSASAARATRLTDHIVNVYCDGVHPTSGTGIASFGASVSDLNGPDAYFDAWNGDEPVDRPDVTRDYGQPAVVTWDGTTLRGSFALVDATGTAAGSATFSAVMTPVGDPYAIDDSFRDGNRRYEAKGAGQPMQPAGSLILSTGPTFDLADCYAEESTISVFATNPTSFVAHYAQRTVGCELLDLAGNTGSFFVDLSDSDAYVEAFVEPASGAPSIGAFGSGLLVGATFHATLDTFFADTGEPAGPGSVQMTFTSTGEKFEVLLKDATDRRVTRGAFLDIEGTLTIDAYSFDLGACVGQDYRTKIIATGPQGPRPGGKVPANDLPSGAKLLAIGGSATLQTKGASPDREAPYECLTFVDETGGIFELPVANTVWYRVAGTGGQVTIDSAGSDFDTVMAVYTADGAGGYTPVPDGCVDDVPVQPFGRTLQAAVTIPTVAGTSYYVQIGGYPGEAFPYGNLRVSVK